MQHYTRVLFRRFAVNETPQAWTAFRFGIQDTPQRGLRFASFVAERQIRAAGSREEAAGLRYQRAQDVAAMDVISYPVRKS